MIRLRDNRFGSFARSFRRMAETDRYFAPQNPDFKESVIDKVPEDLWQILTRFNGKTLSQLRQISNGSLLTLGDIANDTAEQAFFQLFDPRFIPERSHPESFALETSNLMGVLKFRHPAKDCAVQMEIHSRFDRDDRQLFLNYMLSKIFQVDFMELVSAGSDHIWEILLAIMFCRKLKDAVPAGLYKEYRTFAENDLNFRGRLDLSRHLRQNYPLGDKIASSYRAITFDNPINHLLRSAVELICRKYPALSAFDPDTRDFLTELKSATATWSSGRVRDLLRHPSCRNRIRHPYFAAYFEELRILAKMLLEGDSLSIYSASSEEVSGVVFDGAWLWEMYIASLLEKEGFLHAQYGRTGAIDIFKGAKTGMSQMYPDFYSQKDKIVLDTKYKRAHDGREDLLQLLSYVFITGSRRCGLIYPPQEDHSRQENLGPVGIAQQYYPEKECFWWSFAYSPLPPADVSVQEFAAFMHKEEIRLTEKYIHVMRSPLFA